VSGRAPQAHHWFTCTGGELDDYRLRSLCGAVDVKTTEVPNHPEILRASPRSLGTATADGNVTCEGCQGIAAIEQRIKGFEMPSGHTKGQLFVALQQLLRFRGYPNDVLFAFEHSNGWRVRFRLVNGDGEVVYSHTGPSLRAGDVVRHEPSREKWVLAYGDMEADEVAACGWPPSVAKASDCVLVDAATDEQHEAMLRQWAEEVPKSHNGYDHRVSACRRQLQAMRARTEATP
jgi:hypothetical protein